MPNLHRKPEDVDQFLACMPDEMRAEDAVGRFVDDDLRPRHGLGIGFRREPAEHVVDVNVDGKALLPCARLRSGRRRRGRDGVDRGRHARVVGAVLRAFDDVAADDVALIGRDRRQLRRDRQRIAADMDQRVRGRPQMAVDATRPLACSTLPAARSSVSTLAMRPAPLTTRSASAACSAPSCVKITRSRPLAGSMRLTLTCGLDADADALALGLQDAPPRRRPSPAAAAAGLRGS